MGDRAKAPDDRFCDLVMKGGIASGIVYPLAVSKLAEHYRFRSIGGTSAGAVAAVVTAAAELQRRNTGSMAGFQILEQVADDLRKDVGNDERRLKYLFQPQPQCRRLFQVLVGSLNKPSATSILKAVVRGFLVAYWPVTVLAVAFGALAFWWYWSMTGPIAAAIAAMLIAVVVAVGLIAAWVYRDITHGVVDNGYGLCRGPGNAGGHDAITPWLHSLVQKAAGRDVDGKPVTFGDLWTAKGFPTATLAPMPEDTRSIDLVIFTTNLAHGRPYLFPHKDDRARLFFKSKELEGYLPTTVLQWMQQHAAPYVPNPNDGDPSVQDMLDKGLQQVPDAACFPVLLAARMSHSFPLLFSCVPLYAIDYQQPKNGSKQFRRCWFSDGGIASNFPMHLFDGFLPAWPTFGIDLEAMLEDEVDVVVPQSYLDSSEDRWDRFDDSKKRSSQRFGGFLLAVFATAQNWNDNTHARMPGVRDRVARVRLKDDEGGFNLNMKPDKQENVAGRGHRAAVELVKRFCPDGDGTPGGGWDQQRWERLDVLLRTLEKRMPGVELALRDLPDTSSYASLVSESLATVMPGHQRALTDDEAKAVNELLQLMIATARQILRHTRRYSARPIPDPELRVRAPL